jgi:hypothetical protein
VSFPTSASPIVADLDGDGTPEVVLPSNWELVVWNTSGQQLSRQKEPPEGAWVLTTQYSVGSTAAVGDIDGDGLNELLTASAFSNTGAQGAIYAWDLTALTNPDAMPWPAFRRSANNHARLQEPTSSIVAGTVTDGNGTGVSGVTISAGSGGSTITASDGSYTLSGLADSSYTLSASKTDCTFAPASRSVSVPPNATGQDFTATCTVPTFAISGQVTDGSGNPIAGVTIAAGSNTNTITNNAGSYTLDNLPVGTYTLTAAKTNCTFAPASRSVSVPPDTTNQHFTATCQAQLHYAPDKLIVLRTFDSTTTDIRQVTFRTDPDLPAYWKVTDISDPHGIMTISSLQGTTDEPLQVIFNQMNHSLTRTLGTDRYTARVTLQVATTTTNPPQTFEPVDIFVDLLMLEKIDTVYLPYVKK